MENDTPIAAAASIEDYLVVLDTKGTEKAKEYIHEYFGVEGTEGFKEEEYKAFANEVINHVIDRNNKLNEDEVASQEVATDEAES